MRVVYLIRNIACQACDEPLNKLPDLDEDAPAVNWGQGEAGGPGVYRIHNENGKTLATHIATNTTLPFPNNMTFDTSQCYIENAWSQHLASATKPNPTPPSSACHACVS